MSSSKKTQKKVVQPVAEPNEPEPSQPEPAPAATTASEEPAPVLTPGTIVPVRGRNVSGRNWRSPKERYGTVITTNTLKTSWDKKQERREKLAQVKQRAAAMKEQKEVARQELIDKIKANKERRAQNEIKSAQYQVIKNTAKLRKMSRQQMQQFKKLADIAK